MCVHFDMSVAGSVEFIGLFQWQGRVLEVDVKDYPIAENWILAEAHLGERRRRWKGKNREGHEDGEGWLNGWNKC